MVPEILNMVLQVMALILFLRFFVQLAEIRPHDPFVAPIYQTSNVVDMFSNILPDMANGRFSTAAMVLLFLVKLLGVWGMAKITQQPLDAIGLFVIGSLSFALSVISACQWVIIAMVIVSWIIMLTQNNHPLFALVMQISEPLIAPFRKISPNLGMIDLSPMIAIFAFMLLERMARVGASSIQGMF